MKPARPENRYIDELKRLDDEIQTVARGYGLDFFETYFYVLPYDYLTEIAAHGGFPRRYMHWTNGMEYDRLKKSYEWGAGKIYELVINNDPCYAYLLETNTIMEQKLVMAHVFAHCDFFKNNIYFSRTNRNMIDEMANHAARIDGYMNRFGIAKVEDFLDAVLSIQSHIDMFSPFIRRRPQRFRNSSDLGLVSPSEGVAAGSAGTPQGGEARPGHGAAINFLLDAASKDFSDARKAAESAEEKQKKGDSAESAAGQEFRGSVNLPERDLLLFLLENAPLEKWQEDCLAMLREERYYFAPQGQTKIMNEGWASYWHYLITTQHFLEPCETIDFAMDHSSTLANNPMQINPYHLGFILFNHIEANLGRKMMFEIRSIENDYTFLEKYMTRDFCDRHKLFTYDWDPATRQWVVSGRDFDEIKARLLDDLINFGVPYIVVEEDNYRNRGELLLRHHHERDLHAEYCMDTLKKVAMIWKRPVHLLTRVEGQEKTYSIT